MDFTIKIRVYELVFSSVFILVTLSGRGYVNSQYNEL